MSTRRGFLSGILAAGFAPAAIGSGILMPIRQIALPRGSPFDFSSYTMTDFESATAQEIIRGPRYVFEILRGKERTIIAAGNYSTYAELMHAQSTLVTLHARSGDSVVMERRNA